MLSDLDTLMRARGLEAVVVPMHDAVHPSFRWLMRGVRVTFGFGIKLLDREPVLVTFPMEREEAAKSGLEVRLVDEFGFAEIFKSATTVATGYAELLARVLRAYGVRESIAILGNVPLHLYLGIVDALPFRVFRGEDLVQLARKRKDAREIAHIRSVGERTELVVDGVRKLLREGTAKTLGDLKRFVSDEIARLGMIEDDDTILSQGHDAGIPHSRGDANEPIRDGVPIVLDIFPVDRASGYFFDMTRTFCLGAIPDELRRLHADVLDAFERARDAVRPGAPASAYQALVCDIFESKHYPTLRSHPGTHEGYVHSLGHGVGLEIHEKPSFALVHSNRDLIEEGDVITIEPGLYYPDRNLGVRIEDTFVVTKDGVETMCRTGYGLGV